MSVVAVLTVAALVSAVLCIRNEYAGNRQRVYLFKPATMICIIALAFVIAAMRQSPTLDDYRYWIIAGLCFGLVGDILLMLPQDRFLAGLGAFLLTHWCYIVALAGLPSDPNLLVLIAWLTAGVALFLLMKPKEPVVAVAVVVYIASIVVMTWLAVDNWRLSQTGGAAAAGAVLFMFSDTLIGFRRFRRKWTSARALILGSYFPAQWLFAVSLSGM